MPIIQYVIGYSVSFLSRTAIQFLQQNYEHVLSPFVGENNHCIPPTLEGWVYIIPVHGPLYTWAQYTPTETISNEQPPRRKDSKVYASSLLDNLVTFSPYNSSKHFICKSSPLVEGNPGTKTKTKKKQVMML